MIDWAARAGQGEEGSKVAEHVKRLFESERNYRPATSLNKSPFFNDILMTVHDFHFSIWKTSVEDYDFPIFRSANTFGAHNTCGAFSPSRASVIFISKTDGVDVWDFFDQSHKPSMKINFTANALTCFNFQESEINSRS